MYRRSISLLVVVLVLTLIFASTAWAGNMQQSLLERLPQQDEQLTRGEFIAMLVSAANIPAPTKTIYLPLDVRAGSWYANEIKAAQAAGIIAGTGGDSISPNQPITQAQAVALISRVLGLPGMEAPGPLPISAPQNHWASVPYSWLIKEGILTSVNPEAVMSPLEGASLLDKIFGTTFEAKSLNEKSQSAHANIKSMRVTGDMFMSMEGNPNFPGIKTPEQVNVRSNVTMELNLEQGLRQQFTMTMSGLPEPMPPVEMEQYIVNEGIYMKIKDPGTGISQWISVNNISNLNELLKQQSGTMQLPKELEKYFYYRLVGEKTIGDFTYYDLAFYGNIPNLAQFMSLVGGQTGLSPELKENLAKSTDMITGISMVGRTLIEKNSYLTHKLNASTMITFKDNLAEPNPYKSLLNSFNFTYKDYNASIEIKLPPEATATSNVLPAQ